MALVVEGRVLEGLMARPGSSELIKPVGPQHVQPAETQGLQVHHNNETSHHNSAANLRWIAPSAHALLHGIGFSPGRVLQGLFKEGTSDAWLEDPQGRCWGEIVDWVQAEVSLAHSGAWTAAPGRHSRGFGSVLITPQAIWLFL